MPAKRLRQRRSFRLSPRVSRAVAIGALGLAAVGATEGLFRANRRAYFADVKGRRDLIAEMQGPALQETRQQIERGYAQGKRAPADYPTIRPEIAQAYLAEEQRIVETLQAAGNTASEALQKKGFNGSIVLSLDLEHKLINCSWKPAGPDKAPTQAEMEAAVQPTKESNDRKISRATLGRSHQMASILFGDAQAALSKEGRRMPTRAPYYGWLALLGGAAGAGWLGKRRKARKRGGDRK